MVPLHKIRVIPNLILPWKLHQQNISRDPTLEMKKVIKRNPKDNHWTLLNLAINSDHRSTKCHWTAELNPRRPKWSLFSTWWGWFSSPNLIHASRFVCDRYSKFKTAFRTKTVRLPLNRFGSSLVSHHWNCWKVSHHLLLAFSFWLKDMTLCLTSRLSMGEIPTVDEASPNQSSSKGLLDSECEARQKLIIIN